MARIASLLAAAAILIAFMAGAFTFTWWLAIAALALLALAVLDEIGPRAWVYAHRGTGFWGPPMRLGPTPEIAELTLVAG